MARHLRNYLSLLCSRRFEVMMSKYDVWKFSPSQHWALRNTHQILLHIAVQHLFFVHIY